ncbi:MAG TPA: alpha/beta fold hydrolase [Mycobacteriales bacterium]|nr:alpha/beta fold hydrolase [Mycobacteriales bacterium]
MPPHLRPVRDVEAPPLQFRTIHGHRRAFRIAGSGPALLLIHGVGDNSKTWEPVLAKLAQRFTVIAPDLLGHGESAKPRGDYSLGAYASGIRDLLAVLGHERATIVGHSLGGGVAMQFAYQFPQICERLVLVASGGLGKEVNPFLRAVSLPGSEYLLPLVLHRSLHDALGTVGGWFGRLGLRGGEIAQEVWRSYTALTEVRGQMAFVHTIRSVIDVRGQRVSARDRLYLAAEVPTLIVWGDRDRIIPVSHAHLTHELIPGSRLVVVEGAGHFLPVERPAAFLEALEDFLATTEPAPADDERLRQLLRTSAALQ